MSAYVMEINGVFFGNMDQVARHHNTGIKNCQF